MTAAHCVSDFLPASGSMSSGGAKSLQYLYVRLGDKDVGTASLDAQEPCSQTLAVSEIVFHPSYEPDSLQFDLAFIRVTGNIWKSPCVCRICNFQENSLEEFLPLSQTLSCVASSYGSQSDGIEADVSLNRRRLLVSNVTVIPSVGECEANLASLSVLPPDFTLQSSHFCVDNSDGLHGLCSGDGGSPLACRTMDSENFFLVGLGAWSINCDSSPAVYQSVLDSQ